MRHAVGIDSDEIVEVQGILVTSLARTVVDLAASASFASGVITADFALSRRRTGHLVADDLERALRSRSPFAAETKASRVVEFATPLAESPLESVSRVNMHLLGFPVPRLQHEWFDYLGRIGFSDFDWEEFSKIGEADGREKYFRDEFARGRTPEEVIWDEKRREDRMRGTGQSFTRWDWRIGSSARRLRAHLVAAGLFPSSAGRCSFAD